VEIIVLAVIAGAILFKLFSVLGQKTGEERQPPNPLERRPRAERKEDGKVVQLPHRPANAAAADTSSAQGLTELQIADRSFESQAFLAGAKSAYEMIVCAFAAGDKAELRALLADGVYENFERAIDARAAREEEAVTEFVEIGDASIVSASVKDGAARVTVDFVSQQIRAVKNKDGAVIQGDPARVDTVKDRWTFERAIASRDPNWSLVATGVAA